MKPWRKIIALFPSIGILLFIALYVYSTTLYPGGSSTNRDAVGFDWLNNYWCDLLAENSINGHKNPAQPIGIIATLLLCISLMLFFIQFANFQSTNPIRKTFIKIGGIVATTLAMFIFTIYHDLVITLSSIFGAFAILSMLWEIFKTQLNMFKIGGVICVFLVLLNNYVFYSDHLITHLPIIQKSTFVIIFSWIIGLNFNRNKKILL